MEYSRKFEFVFLSIKFAAILSLILLCGSALLMLGSCAGRSINNTQDLKKILSEEENPKDIGLSDEVLCNAAAEYANKNGYNPPLLLYTNPEGNIKAKPGGKVGVKNTPNGTEMVMLMVNTGAKPIVVANKMLNKGEIAIYRLSSSVIEIPGIVLKPAQ
jgi:hypothetical protein